VRLTHQAATRQARPMSSRPLDAAVFIDAIVVKVRDGQVANRPVYAAIGVTVDGRKDVLGLWAGVGGEGAKFWMIRNTFRLTSRADSDAIKRDIRLIYSAPNVDAALAALEELEENGEPNIGR
jgi:putative transposase